MNSDLYPKSDTYHISRTVSELNFANEQLKSLGRSIGESKADKQQLGTALLSMAQWFEALSSSIATDLEAFTGNQTSGARSCR